MTRRFPVALKDTQNMGNQISSPRTSWTARLSMSVTPRSNPVTFLEKPHQTVLSMARSVRVCIPLMACVEPVGWSAIRGRSGTTDG
ncbi:hypothetical protein [Nocardia gamkensis]|uniref:Uncharacterized protein n=1 Tax=Nocardia gamkensis TaxID=352869 RepID=A0A7X6L9W7_9NOCA|nr:hypothetical protein [Nocardia gamkensis]NKY30576.1 hypothetical protein [Nocardia gamkensis]